MLSFDDVEVQRETDLPLDKLRKAQSYPQFRFMGSKHKLLPWLAGIFRYLEFDSALDAFSGSRQQLADMFSRRAESMTI